MKRRNLASTESTVDETKANLLHAEKIGNKDLRVYVEQIDNTNTYDFSFTIDNTFFKSTKDYSINELFKIFCIVQDTLVNYIEKNVLPLTKEGNIIQLIIGACGESQESISMKNEVYAKQLNKLIKKYNCSVNILDGDYILTFK